MPVDTVFIGLGWFQLWTDWHVLTHLGLTDKISLQNIQKSYKQVCHIVFKYNILKSRLNMRFKSECQSCTTTAHPLQSTLESTGASPLPSLSIFFFFFSCIFTTAGLCLSHTRLPKITGDGSYKLNIGVSLLLFI